MCLLARLAPALSPHTHLHLGVETRPFDLAKRTNASFDNPTRVSPVCPSRAFLTRHQMQAGPLVCPSLHGCMPQGRAIVAGSGFREPRTHLRSITAQLTVS